MKYCPILSFQTDRYCEIGCREERCAFADDAGDCLVRQALQCYVSKERTRVAQETESVNVYARIFKDGSWKPIHFMTPDEDKTSVIET